MNSASIKLFPYQEVGAAFLAARKFAILGDEMGLGKSCQAITAADRIGAKRILVICRAVARANWANEFQKFSCQPCGLNQRRIEILYSKDFEDPGEWSVTICSYETLPGVLATKSAYDVVIVDEAHYIKNPEAVRTQQVLGKNGIVKRTTHLWELTGTPTPNHAGELWTHLFTFGITKLKYNDFVDYYCDVRNNGFNRRQIVGTNMGRVAELKQLLKPIFLRRTIEGAGMSEQIPNIFYQDLVVKPGKVRLDMSKTFIRYVHPFDKTKDLEALLQEELGAFQAIVDKGFTFETIKAMEMAAKSVSTLRRINGMQKIEPVVELLTQELNDHLYEKVVIFATHRDTIEQMHIAMRKFRAVKMYGGSDPHTIEERVKLFQRNKFCRVFIGNISSAGTSINLTAANQLVIMEPDWVPGNNMQAIKRCHRIGQTKPVFVRFVSLADSIDQHIANILKRKTEQISELLGDTPQSTGLEKAGGANMDALL